LVFGAQDTSLNRIFGAAKLTRLCPLFGAGDTPLHPIWVEDLARAVVEFGAERALSGAHNLPGPVALTFRQTLAAMFRAGGLNPVPAFVPVPVGIAKAGARLLGVLPNPPLTAEAIDFLTTGPGMPLPVEEPAHGLLSRFQATCATPEAVFETYLKGG
jgi:NADH dehydrogenase